MTTKLHKIWLKLWRNRRHNRLWVVLGNRLFLRVPVRFRRFAPPGYSPGEGEVPNQRVYRSIVGLFSARTGPGQWGVTAPHQGMFGNSVAGLIPKMAMATELGYRKVFVLGVGPFVDPRLFDAGGEHRLDDGFTIAVHESASQAGASGLVGLVHALGSVPVSPKSSLLAWSRLSSVLIGDWEVSKIPAHKLVIHLRGGEVYGGKREQPNHGQPPLSYYTAVIKAQRCKEVLIVHQAGIPFLEELLDWCSQNKISAQTQSGDLREDLGMLLGATVLAAGRGSFVPAIAGLAPFLEKVYFFESGFGLGVPRPSLQIVRVEDISQRYVKEVLSNNWQRKKSQIETMIDYPESEIRILDDELGK